MKLLLYPLLFLLLIGQIWAQTDSTKIKTNSEDEEAAEPANETDLSKFQGDLEEAEGVKRYCTSKIFGLAPTKLISLGYDYQLGYDMIAHVEGNPAQHETQSVSATHGLRFLANFPVISTNKITLNIGANYMESNYNFAESSTLRSPLMTSLRNNALRSTGLSFTVFKPLNEKHFLLFNSQHELNGDYRLDEWQSLGYLKHSVAVAFGWKKHDRLQYGFGVARTYRVGELNYIPVILYNYTSESRKWGVEAFFPARAHFRRSFNPRNILLVGYELEGGSYRLQNRNNEFNSIRPQSNDLEIRRSELRFRVVYETQLYGFFWLSVQAGYRRNYNFKVDNGDFFRGFFGDQKYVMENHLTNPLYFNISINLVSP